MWSCMNGWVSGCCRGPRGIERGCTNVVWMDAKFRLITRIVRLDNDSLGGEFRTNNSATLFCMSGWSVDRNCKACWGKEGKECGRLTGLSSDSSRSRRLRLRYGVMDFAGSFLPPNIEDRTKYTILTQQCKGVIIAVSSDKEAHSRPNSPREVMQYCCVYE